MNDRLGKIDKGRDTLRHKGQVLRKARDGGIGSVLQGAGGCIGARMKCCWIREVRREWHIDTEWNLHRVLRKRTI